MKITVEEKQYLLRRRKVLNMALPKKQWIDTSLDKLDQYQRDHLWDMYEKTYSKLGLSVATIEKMFDKYKVSWFINVDNDPDSDAFIIYVETKYGNKLALMGSNGSSDAKRELVRKIIMLFRAKGWYGEASHKIASILENNGIPPIDDFETVKRILSEKGTITWLGNGEYERTLKGVGKVTKKLYGYPKKGMM
jgi:hypothetical protein